MKLRIPSCLFDHLLAFLFTCLFACFFQLALLAYFDRTWLVNLRESRGGPQGTQPNNALPHCLIEFMMFNLPALVWLERAWRVL